METQTHINNLTDALGEHLSALSASSTALKTALNDHRKRLWWSVPSSVLDTEFDHVETLKPNEADWASVETQLTNIWMESNSGSHQHGLLVCGVAEVLEQISAFNQAKLDVAQSIKDLKDVLNGIRGTDLRESSKSNKDIKNEDFARARDEYLAKGRDIEFHHLVRRKGFNEIDFRKAKRRIWVTPSDVLEFKYVWSKSHYRKNALPGSVFKALRAHYQRIDMETPAKALADSLVSQSIRDDTDLFSLSFSKPVMRANVKYGTDEGSQWTNRHAPGITVIPQADPPRIQWRPAPTEEERKEAEARWRKNHQIIEVRLTDRITVYRERSDS